MLTIYSCFHYEQQLKDYPHLTTTEGVIPIYGPNDPINLFICEMSMFKYVADNDKDSDYIGTSHYRRFVYPSDIDISKLNEGYIYTYCKQQDYYPLHGLKEFTGDNFFRCSFLYDDFIDYVIEKYGEHNKYYKEIIYTNEHDGIFCARNIAVIPRKDFLDFCDLFFGFLDYIETKYNLERNYDSYYNFIIDKYIKPNIGKPMQWGWTITSEIAYTPYLLKVIGYFSEWLFSIFLTATFGPEKMIPLHDGNV